VEHSTSLRRGPRAAHNAGGTELTSYVPSGRGPSRTIAISWPTLRKPCAAMIPNSARCARNAFTSIVRWRNGRCVSASPYRHRRASAAHETPRYKNPSCPRLSPAPKPVMQINRLT
jgi:hypothetical protein